MKKSGQLESSNSGDFAPTIRGIYMPLEWTPKKGGGGGPH